MDEHALATLHGAVVVHDPVTEKWKTVGTSTGLSTIRLLRCMSTNTFRIHARKINDVNEVVLDSQITKDIRFNRSSPDFIQWADSQTFMGINFRRGDAEKFFQAITEILQTLKQGQIQISQPPMTNPALANQQMQQTSAAIIQQQRSIQQQQQMIQPPQQPMMHQQQAHLMMQQQQQAQAMLGQAPPTQILQQPPPQQQPNQPLLQQQQQLHQHYMQQQKTQAQSHPNQSQMNHYQHPHQTHQTHLQLQQQMQMQQRPPQPQPQPQQQQSAPVVSAPIPPPPPPPPPAPPASVVPNLPRINGTSNTNQPCATNNEVHQPTLSTNSNSTSLDANGTSPSQVSSLANELAKCQLKKVNISRSDSEKESECNNNIVGNPKNRSASLAAPHDNLMNDLNKRLAMRRERLDQQGDGQANNSNSSITNGTSNDKSHESWLADLIRKEIRKEISNEMSKMKAEILEAIRSEFKH